MKDYVLFRLKTLWAFDPDHRPKELDLCAKCGHPFRYHKPGCIIQKSSDLRLCTCKGFMINLHDQIKTGEKTCEWRDATPYWLRLLTTLPSAFYLPISSDVDESVDLTKHLRVKKAWMTFGYPKDSLPRFEIDLIRLTLFPATKQFKIDFANVKEKVK